VKEIATENRLTARSGNAMQPRTPRGTLGTVIGEPYGDRRP
jgi:hypothetical protein